jgi:beta-lactamase class D
MRRLAGCLVLLLAPWKELYARSYQDVPELANIFQRQGLEGTFVLLDASSDTVFVSNRARAEQRFIPASTFKIANSLKNGGTGVGLVEVYNLP